MLQPPEFLPDSAPRLQSDRYVMLARVGKGGMAGVYAAWDVRDQSWRALKVLLPRLARDVGIRKRFVQEGVTMASLNHPNLVRVFEIGEAPMADGAPLPFIVMELLNGGSLHRWVRTHGKMPPRMAVSATIQLLQGLEVVHASGVVHRDVKPKNLLADDASILKLTDFGIAQLEASGETKTGLAMGTLGYMAPEQLHDAKSVDPRSDLYGVAASAWTLLTTQKPRDLFRLEDRPELMTEVPESLRPLLSRCLAYERTDRPPSARAVADELRELLLGLPEDPPGTPDLSLHLGLPDLRTLPPDPFSELTLGGGAFQGTGGNSDSDLNRSRLGNPITRPGAADAAQQVGRRLGAKRFEASAPAEIRPDLPYVGRADPSPGRSSGPPPASYADMRRASDARAEVPSYIDLPPPGAPPAPAKVPAPVKAAGALSVLGGLGLAAVVGTFLLGIGIAGYGASAAGTLRAREAAFREHAVELDRHVGYLEGFPDEMVLIGADGTEARTLWAAWHDEAPGFRRTELALVFCHVTERDSLPHLPQKGEGTPEQLTVQQRLDRAEPKVRATEFALSEWTSSASGSAAQLAILLQLADRPPGMP